MELPLPVIWAIVAAVTSLSHGLSNNQKRLKEISVRNEINEILRELEDLTARSQQGNQGNQVDTVTNNARDWLDENDEKLRQRYHAVALAAWDYSTNLTDANAERLSELDVTISEWVGEQVKEAKSFLKNKNQIDDSNLVRQLEAWANGQSVPIADDKATINAISQGGTELESIYGNAQVEKDDKIYRIEPEFTELMSTSRDYDELEWAWLAWRDATGPKMKETFTELVDNMNKAAKENGLNDIGEAWRQSNYEDENIIPTVDKLYGKILKIYEQLHAFVRYKLIQQYGEDKIDPKGPIPAHLLGDMWGQEWMNIVDIVTPFPDVDTYDVTSTMVAKGYTPNKMFRLAEEFFISIGLDPMTDKFWEKSMIVRPDDRPVQCHASAEDFLTQDDFRIKMCTVVDMQYLQTIHHEMGHVEYFMQYKNQPTVFRSGANSAFHEAIGDTIALSVMTPEHLHTIGLLEEKPKELKQSKNNKNCFTSNIECTKDEKRELNQLMKIALEKIAFLPFGYLIDKWRWDVFSGVITPDEYNTKWWEYRTKYQGLKAPVARSEDDFDPGAKYHVAAFVPYIRYFLSFIGQFQFHEALCAEKGHTGSLSHCDIYKSTEAGKLLKSVLSKGSSEPWPDVMKEFTGQSDFSTTAIASYFEPLYNWLTIHNREAGITVGWSQ